jgi:hypothetical protein
MSQGIEEKKDEHMKAHIKKWMMIAMSQNN